MPSHQIAETQTVRPAYRGPPGLPLARSSSYDGLQGFTHRRTYPVEPATLILTEPANRLIAVETGCLCSSKPGSKRGPSPSTSEGAPPNPLKGRGVHAEEKL